jgi:hypothetical protein
LPSAFPRIVVDPFSCSRFCREISASLPTLIRFYDTAGGGVASAVGVQCNQGDRGAAHGSRSQGGAHVAIGGPRSGGRRTSTPLSSIPVVVGVARSSWTRR